MELVESAIGKIALKVLREGKGWIDRRRYNRAVKGVATIANELYDLHNVAVDDPQKDEKKAKYEEFRTHFIAIRNLLDEISR